MLLVECQFKGLFIKFENLIDFNQIASILENVDIR